MVRFEPDGNNGVLGKFVYPDDEILVLFNDKPASSGVLLVRATKSSYSLFVFVPFEVYDAAQTVSREEEFLVALQSLLHGWLEAES